MASRSTGAKPPVKIYQTLQSTAPLASEIHDAWRGMADSLRTLQVRQEYRSSIRSLYEYADMNLRAHGEGVLLAETMRKNPAIKAALAGGDDPIVKPDHHAPEFLVYLGVQVGGSPAIEFNDMAGKKQDGPGKILRSLPTTDLAERYGDTLSALDRMAAICFDAKKLTVAKWALSKARDVRLATLQFAIDNGLERELRMYTARKEELTGAQIGELFRHWMQLTGDEFASRQKGATGTRAKVGTGDKPAPAVVPASPVAAFAAAAGVPPVIPAGLEPARGVATATPKPARKRAAPVKRAA